MLHPRNVETFTKEVTIKKQPSKVLLQVGTNDLTRIKSSADVITKINNTITMLGSEFPDARIYVSSLLPRKDKLNKTAMEINKLLEEYCDSTKKVTFIDHTNSIGRSDLYDNLHIDAHGFYKFLWNIRYGMFGLLPPTNKRCNNRRR